MNSAEFLGLVATNVCQPAATRHRPLTTWHDCSSWRSNPRASRNGCVVGVDSHRLPESKAGLVQPCAACGNTVKVPSPMIKMPEPEPEDYEFEEMEISTPVSKKKGKKSKPS